MVFDFLITGIAAYCCVDIARRYFVAFRALSRHGSDLPLDERRRRYFEVTRLFALLSASGLFFDYLLFQKTNASATSLLTVYTRLFWSALAGTLLLAALGYAKDRALFSRLFLPEEKRLAFPGRSEKRLRLLGLYAFALALVFAVRRLRGW